MLVSTPDSSESSDKKANVVVRPALPNRTTLLHDHDTHSYR